MIDVSSENLSKLSNQMFEDFIVRSTYDLATRYPYVQLNHTFESLKAYVSSRFAMYKKQGLQYYSTLAFNVELHFLFGHNFQNNPLYRQIREQLQPDSSQDESYYYSTLYDVVSEQCEQTHGDENQHFHQAVKDAEKLYQNREQLDPILITQYLQQVFPTKYHYFEQHLSADMEHFGKNGFFKHNSRTNHIAVCIRR